MKPTIPSKDQIPRYDEICDLKIEPDVAGGRCLSHATILLEVEEMHFADCPYLVCMGPVEENVLHCWLEAGEIVADFTQPEGRRFYYRNEYYEILRISDDLVKRYTFEYASGRAMRNGGSAEFWEFDLTRFHAAPTPPAQT